MAGTRLLRDSVFRTPAVQSTTRHEPLAAVNQAVRGVLTTFKSASASTHGNLHVGNKD